MSERGSFVTEYMYCEGCFERMEKVLCTGWQHLDGHPVHGKFIIAGRIGGTEAGGQYPGGEFDHFELIRFNAGNAPCHPVRVAVLADSGASRVYVVHPNGSVTIQARSQFTIGMDGIIRPDLSSSIVDSLEEMG